MFKILSSIAAAGVAAVPTDVSLLATGTGAPSISKIVAILQKTAGDVALEQHTLDAEHKKFTCWSEKFTGEFADLQERAQAQLEQADATITEMSAKSASETERIKQSNDGIAEIKKSIDEAIDRQVKTLEEDNNQKTQFTETIESLDSALVVLNGAKADLLSVVSSVKKVLLKNNERVPTSFEPTLALLSGAQMPQNGYQKQSGQITGILSQMKEDFEKDLDELVQKMATDKATSEELIQNFKDQHKAMEKTLAQAEAALADAQAALEQAKIAKSEAEQTLTITGDDLTAIHDKIGQTNEEHAKRVANMAVEQQQLNKAIEIVTSDEFNNAMKDADVGSGPSAKSFLQIGADRARKSRMDKATAALRKHGNTALLNLAASMKAGAGLDAVVEAIDGLAAELDASIKQEAEMKAAGVSAINNKDGEVASQGHQIERQSAAIEALQTECTSLSQAVEQANTDLTTNEELKQKAEDMHTEKLKNLNDEIAADVRAIAMLKKVQHVLEKVFDSGKMTSRGFVQIRSVTAEEPMKVEKTVEYEAVDSEQSTTKIGKSIDNIKDFTFSKRNVPTDIPALLEKIVGEAQSDKAVAQNDIKNLSTIFDKDMHEFAKTIGQLTKDKANAETEGAVCNTKHTTAKRDLKNFQALELSLAEELDVLHNTYNFIIKWQERRAGNMMQEKDDLNAAKAFLLGADFGTD